MSPRPKTFRPVETAGARSWTVQEPGRRLGPIRRIGTMTHTTATGGARPFRFGVVAPLTTDLPTWRDRVRRIADNGHSTLLMPDVPQAQPAPGPALALAASMANLRVGTCVYASPLHPTGST